MRYQKMERAIKVVALILWALMATMTDTAIGALCMGLPALAMAAVAVSVAWGYVEKGETK